MLKIKKKRMLLVEDMAAICIIIKIHFAIDHDISVLENGRGAIDWLLLGNLPDIVLLDINMPVMNGLEFLKEASKLGLLKRTPIIILSAEESSKMKIEAFKSGASDYVTKPFNPIELRVRIERFFVKSDMLTDFQNNLSFSNRF